MAAIPSRWKQKKFLEKPLTIHQSVRRNVRNNSTLYQYHCTNLNCCTAGGELYLQIWFLHDKLFLGILKTKKQPVQTSHATWKSANVNKNPSLDPTLCQINTVYMPFIYLYTIFLYFFLPHINTKYRLIPWRRHRLLFFSPNVNIIFKNIT